MRLIRLQHIFCPSCNIVEQFSCCRHRIHTLHHNHVNAMTILWEIAAQVRIYVPNYITKRDMVFRPVVLNDLVEVI